MNFVALKPCFIAISLNFLPFPEDVNASRKDISWRRLALSSEDNWNVVISSLTPYKPKHHKTYKKIPVYWGILLSRLEPKLKQCVISDLLFWRWIKKPQQMARLHTHKRTACFWTWQSHSNTKPPPRHWVMSRSISSHKSHIFFCASGSYEMNFKTKIGLLQGL